jgi:hypothetical protein
MDGLFSSEMKIQGKIFNFCACFHVYDFVDFDSVGHQSCNAQQIN